MTRVQILQVPSAARGAKFQAVFGNRQASGETVGQALDAVSKLFTDEEPAVIVVGRLHGDEFFAEEKVERLSELMSQWRACRDSGTAFPEADQRELEALVDEELQSSSDRAAAMSKDLPR